MPKKPILSNISQICIVTRNLERTMKKYVSLGVGPFRVYSMDTRKMTGVTYRGKPADYSLKVAWAKLGSWTLELIEPTRGVNIYTEFLEKHGEGIQHLGIYVDDYDAAFGELIRREYKQIQGGPIDGIDKTGRFDYFETEKEYGTILELLDMPENIGEPDYVYTESA
jgi:methylmalonyl-CoA/ethylmalonyl-CoA epimerase